MRFILFNGLLFFGLSGILFYQYFFQSPLSGALAIAATSTRTPAAVKVQLAKNLPSKKALELDWKYSLNCMNSEQAMARSRDSVILNIKTNIKKCEKRFPKNLIIENQSNGFTASVFTLDNANAKTDSIPLKKGKNIIIIKYQLSKAMFKAKASTKAATGAVSANVSTADKAETDIVEKISIEY